MEPSSISWRNHKLNSMRQILTSKDTLDFDIGKVTSEGALLISNVIECDAGISHIFQFENVWINREKYRKYMIRFIKFTLLVILKALSYFLVFLAVFLFSNFPLFDTSVFCFSNTTLETRAIWEKVIFLPPQYMKRYTF